MSSSSWTISSYASSAIATLSGWALNDWLSLFGFFAVLFTSASSFYFRRRELEIKRAHLALQKDLIMSDKHGR